MSPSGGTSWQRQAFHWTLKHQWNINHKPISVSGLGHCPHPTPPSPNTARHLPALSPAVDGRVAGWVQSPAPQCLRGCRQVSSSLLWLCLCSSIEGLLWILHVRAWLSAQHTVGTLKHCPPCPFSRILSLSHSLAILSNLHSCHMCASVETL